MEKRNVAMVAKSYGIVAIILSVICGIAIWAMEPIGWGDSTALDYLFADIFEDGVNEFLIGLIVMALGATPGFLFFCFGEFMGKAGWADTSVEEVTEQIENVTAEEENAERMEELIKLRDKGIISEEQFNQFLKIINKS